MGSFAHTTCGGYVPGAADPGMADGVTYDQIMTSLQTSAPTISRWKRRFEQEGIDGLDPRHNDDVK